jgi:hypothetical protein
MKFPESPVSALFPGQVYFKPYNFAMKRRKNPRTPHI